MNLLDPSIDRRGHAGFHLHGSVLIPTSLPVPIASGSPMPSIQISAGLGYVFQLQSGWVEELFDGQLLGGQALLMRILEECFECLSV